MPLTDTFAEKRLSFISVSYRPGMGFQAAIRELASEGYLCGQRWHPTAEEAIAEHFSDPEILDL